MGHSSINRVRIGANVFLQAAVLFAIVVMVNSFAYRHFKRWDFSRDRKYALSEQTVRVLDGLKKPVKLVIYFAGGSDIGADVAALAREYEIASQRKVSVEIINPYLSLTRAREVASQYKLGGQENVVVVDQEGKTRIVNAVDMAEYEPALNPLQPPVLKAFKGEQALTGALLEVSEEGANKLYVLAGHGEPSLDNPSFSALKTFIARQNAQVEPLRLTDVEAVPEDARALLVLGPKYDLSEQEASQIEAYWGRKGRLFLLLDPAVPVPRLAAFLEKLGLTPNADRVLKTVPMGPVTYVLKDITGDFLPGSPVTRRLTNVGATLKGGTQSLSLDPEKGKADAIRLLPLIRASKGFWAEKRYEIVGSGNIFFDPKEDTASPVVAASVEKGALDNEQIQVESSRLVAVGNSAFIHNDALTEADLDFVLSGINWLLDREPMIGISPKAVRNFSLSLTDSQLGSLALLTLGAIPGVAAFFGLLAWVRRRR